MKQITEPPNVQYSTLLYNNRHLILKWTKDKEPFVVAECYSQEAAENICNLLETQTDETNPIEER